MPGRCSLDQTHADPARVELRALVASFTDAGLAAGTVRPGVTASDVVVTIWTAAQLVEAFQAVAPELWRRQLALLLDALRAAPTAVVDAPAVAPGTLDRFVASRRAAAVGGSPGTVTA